MRTVTVAGVSLLLAAAVCYDLTLTPGWLSTTLLLVGLLLSLLGPTWLGPGTREHQLPLTYPYRAGGGVCLLAASAALTAGGLVATPIASAGAGLALLIYRAPWLPQRGGNRHDG